MRQMQIHNLGIGPVFWPRHEMGCSVEHFQPKANGIDGRSEQMPITVEEIFY